MSCYCGVGSDYQSCCQLIHQNQSLAKTAEQLMRSRFSAFVVCDADYILQSWHPQTRPKSIDFDQELAYIKLLIVQTWQGQAMDKIGKVEFIAEYQNKGEKGRLHEVSRFKKHSGSWHYLDGKILQD